MLLLQRLLEGLQQRTLGLLVIIRTLVTVGLGQAGFHNERERGGCGFMEQHKLGSYRLKVTFLFYLLIILIFGSILFIRNFTYKVYADPTVVFSSLEYDGSVRNSGSNYATVWSGSEGNYIFNETVPIGQRYVALTYYVMRGFLFFNTSSIPDYATINSTILSLNITVDGSTTDFNLTV